ncbi:UDP-4-amino-4,6-dideoxy-N-acetyl-beta-L-altrosamine N-acetyltransferase [Mobilisporobacter senegalensis]|uniref:UDP-4-amino-4, 6-dideoxy-N-acetyl-beta-L-altrosamine N-acetyltransferase n=1 Tax=Mobilisporobacter senegalensis TaxID=1329262 RepID=A0A3N1XY78_9FIRM|nr:UDP-4-amino-4,6-dideoxy-N-acetyl-beta-L-altrosamine N-acetyltransferase [Mobilisporobacter senegalensis]ROR31540.1 UDP-4-amino-4,6-dideoxy-N-acetyl-beta-L-altrosamine N-acetyltransferase [Mobilisporobacter senegalensis]
MNVKLRRINEDDLERIIKWRMDTDITKWMNTDPTLTIKTQKEWLKNIQNSQTVEYWMIVVNNQPAGIINITDIDKIKKESSWGYYIGEKSLRSLQLAMYLEWNLYDYVFDVLKLKRLYNEVLSLNEGVIKLHQLCGSKVEKVIKNHVIKNNIEYDVTIMSIIDTVWKELRSSKKYDFIKFEMER